MLPEIMALHKIAERHAGRGSSPKTPDNDPELLFALSQNAYIEPAKKTSPLSTAKDARRHITLPKLCPGCQSSQLLYLGGVRPTFRFRHEYIPVLYCQNCGTLCTPHNVMLDSHDPSLAWHLSVEARNRSAARKLFAEVAKYHGRPVRRILEIGCGPGWLLSELSTSVSTVGYETNPYCVAYGRERLGLDIKNELFTSSTDANFDLLFCISTIEHIENPDELLFAISESCKKNEATACLFVPFFSDEFIKYIYNTWERVPQNPFWAVPAHVVHYTKNGFLQLLTRFGGHEFQQCKSNGVWGATICKF